MRGRLLPPHVKVVLRVKRRRPLTWTLGLMERVGNRWRFARWSLYACCTGHFQYCRRRDRTRNLVLEGTYCVEVERPECVGSRQKCEKVLYERLEASIRAGFARAESELLEECFRCFAIYPEDVGYHVETEDIMRCRYNRCEKPPRWRYLVAECVFTGEWL